MKNYNKGRDNPKIFKWGFVEIPGNVYDLDGIFVNFLCWNNEKNA